MPRIAYKPLCDSIFKRDHAALAALASADQIAAQHWKPIMDAAFVGDGKSIDILVDNGADVNIKASTGAKHTPLTRLCQFHRTIPKHEGHPVALDRLLAHGANPDVAAGPLDLPPLGYACMGPLHNLIERLKKVSEQSDALTAALLVDVKGLRRYSKKNATGLVDEVQRTPLHYLALSAIAKETEFSKVKSCVNLLLDSGVELDAAQPIQEGDEVFYATALWYAVSWQGNIDLSKYLLERGASPNVAVFSSLFHGDVEICDLLSEFGADWNQRVEGLTPLMDLMKWNRTKLVPWLLERNVDVNATDNEGRTALDYAYKRKIKKTTIDLLIQHGATKS